MIPWYCMRAIDFGHGKAMILQNWYEIKTAATIALKTNLFIEKWKSKKTNLSFAVSVSAITLLHATTSPCPSSHVDWEILAEIFIYYLFAGFHHQPRANAWITTISAQCKCCVYLVLEFSFVLLNFVIHAEPLPSPTWHIDGCSSMSGGKWREHYIYIYHYYYYHYYEYIKPSSIINDTMMIIDWLAYYIHNPQQKNWKRKHKIKVETSLWCV